MDIIRIGIRKNAAKPVAFYVPIALNPKNIPREWHLYAAFFLNLLHWKWCCWQPDESRYIRLKASYILRIIPQEVWPPLRDQLWGSGVIQRNPFWRPGARCQGYRLAPEYRKVRRIVCKDELLNRRIQHVYSRDNQLLPVHRWLESRFDMLDFDDQRAEEIIGGILPDERSGIDIQEYRQLLEGACIRLAYREHSLIVDRFGRVHTPLSSLARQLRYCLSLNGQHLVSIDLANSQPLIAGIVAVQYHSSGSAAQRIRERVFDNSSPVPRCIPRRAGIIRPDLAKYIEVCQRGKLYESLMQADDDREIIKKQWFATIYGKLSRRGPFHSQLQSVYPTLASMLNSLKRRNYQHASHIMQNVEASIFIGAVCQRLMKLRPRMPVFTIHDSILTTEEHAAFVKEVIMHVFKKIDIHPTLKIESYTSLDFLSV